MNPRYILDDGTPLYGNEAIKNYIDMNIPGNPTDTTTDPTADMVASIKANIDSLKARIKANKDKAWLIKVEIAGLEKSVKLAEAMIETITKGPES